MKNTVCLSLFLFATCLSFGQGYKIGVIVDPQIAWIASESKNVDNEGTVIGINGGLSIDKYFQKNYALHTGLTIGTQGGKLRYTEQMTINADGTEVSLPAGSVVDYKLNYITVPLGLKLKTNQIGYFSYYAQLGFTNQFNIKAKASSDDKQLDKDLIKKEIKLYNLSYHFGAGIEYQLSEETAFTVGVTYHNGFLDLTDQSAKVYSRVIALSLGIIF
jgi:long-subunit fatty acid transport protein